MSNQSSNQQTTFQNENISISLERQPQCHVVMKLAVSPKAVAASRQKALRNVCKEVSVPGFRKGKAPLAYIEKNFAKIIEREMKKIVLESSIFEAWELSKIYPLKKEIKKAELQSCSLPDGAMLLLEYESEPEIPSVNYNDLQRPILNKQPITEQMIASAIHNLCLQHAEWNEVSDRGVQEGDYVDVDIDGVSPRQGSVYKNQRLHIEQGKVDHCLLSMLIGAEKGAILEGEYKAKEEECTECAEGTHSHSHAKSDHPTIRITVHGIKHAEIPPFDDQLAKKFGAESAEQLKTRVIATMENQLEEERAANLRSMMIEQLLARYPFDLPASSFSVDPLARQKLLDDFQKAKMEPSKIQEEIKKIEKTAMQQVSQQTKLYYLARKIVEENHLELQDQEVYDEFQEQYMLNQFKQSYLDFSKEMEEIVSKIRYHLTIRKAIDFLIEHAKNEKSYV